MFPICVIFAPDGAIMGAIDDMGFLLGRRLARGAGWPIALGLAWALAASPGVHGQSDPGTLIQQLIRQAWVIGPADLGFPLLQQELLARTGLSGPALAAALQAGPYASPQALGSWTYYPLLSAQEGDLRRVAARHLPSLLLGLLSGPMRLGNAQLPATVGVAVFASSFAFAVALVELSGGQPVAFVLLPASPLIAAPFTISDLLIVQVLVGVIQSTPAPPLFPVALACPSLPQQFPFSVQVGSGLPLLVVTDAAGAVLFQVSDGGLGILRLSSSGPVLFYTLTLGSGATQIGFLFGAGSSLVRVPVGEPFRLVVAGGERRACLQAITWSFSFGAVLIGLAAHN